jgi:hypothetical protein
MKSRIHLDFISFSYFKLHRIYLSSSLKIFTYLYFPMLISHLRHIALLKVYSRDLSIYIRSIGMIIKIVQSDILFSLIILIDRSKHKDNL